MSSWGGGGGGGGGGEVPYRRTMAVRRVAGAGKRAGADAEARPGDRTGAALEDGRTTCAR